MKKRVISLCLIVSLMVALFPIAALSVSAETVVSGTSSEGFLWELDSDGTLTILGEGEMEKNSPAGGGYMSWVDANLGTSYMDQVKKSFCLTVSQISAKQRLISAGTLLALKYLVQY